jgi:L-asparaginase
MKKKILFIFCGGTIAMGKNKKDVLIPIKSAKELLKMVPEVQKLVELEVIELFNIPSSNMTPAHWKKINETIYNEYHNFHGFLISHGTDTMTHTASAISFALGKKLNKPVVLTGSQAYPDSIGTDARFNLVNSFRAVTSNIAEVMICFGHFVLRGNRAVKVSESDYNAFRSPAFPSLGKVKTHLEWSPFAKRKRNINDEELAFKNDFEEDVINLKPSSGITPRMLELLIEEEKIKGVVLESLGAGNMPEYFIPTIKKAKEKRIPFVITSPFSGGKIGLKAMDISGVKSIEAGAISAEDMTTPAASVKLQWSLKTVETLIQKGKVKENKKLEKIKKIIQENYVGELSEEEDIWNRLN